MCRADWTVKLNPNAITFDKIHLMNTSGRNRIVKQSNIFHCRSSTLSSSSQHSSIEEPEFKFDFETSVWVMCVLIILLIFSISGDLNQHFWIKNKMKKKKNTFSKQFVACDLTFIFRCDDNLVGNQNSQKYLQVYQRRNRLPKTAIFPCGFWHLPHMVITIIPTGIWGMLFQILLWTLSQIDGIFCIDSSLVSKIYFIDNALFGLVLWQEIAHVKIWSYIHYDII